MLYAMISMYEMNRPIYYILLAWVPLILNTVLETGNRVEIFEFECHPTPAVGTTRIYVTTN